MKHLVLIVGHNSDKRGAVRVDTGETEWSWNSRVADRARTYATSAYPGLQVSILTRYPNTSTRAEIAEVYARADAIGADATIELHFNSFSSASARGCEMLHGGSHWSEILAEDIQAEVLEAFPSIRDRGVKIPQNDAGGLFNIQAGKAPAVIAEPFFGSSPTDCAAMYDPDGERALARAYIDGAVSMLQSHDPAWIAGRVKGHARPAGIGKSSVMAALRRFFGVM